MSNSAGCLPVYRRRPCAVMKGWPAASPYRLQRDQPAAPSLSGFTRSAPARRHSVRDLVKRECPSRDHPATNPPPARLPRSSRTRKQQQQREQNRRVPEIGEFSAAPPPLDYRGTGITCASARTPTRRREHRISPLCRSREIPDHVEMFSRLAHVATGQRIRAAAARFGARYQHPIRHEGTDPERHGRITVATIGGDSVPGS